MPPSPASAPASVSARRHTALTRTPAYSAAIGWSPTARSSYPPLGREKNQPTPTGAGGTAPPPPRQRRAEAPGGELPRGADVEEPRAQRERDREPRAGERGRLVEHL